MNEILKVNYETEAPTVSARNLHEVLEIGADFRHWFPRMCEYGFEESRDYTPVIFDHPQNGQPTKDFDLSIDMAKEICMIQRTEKGKQCRTYFIELEKAWNTPEQIFARALKMADKVIQQRDKLITEMQPKADYFDELVERNLLTSFRDTSKEFGIKEKDFIGFLLSKNYIYRDTSKKLKPYADKNNGLFELKEFVKDSYVGSQTLITPKGRETFRLLIKGI